MLNLERIQELADQLTSAQEYWAVLAAKAERYNEFDAGVVLQDLVAHPEFWCSFIFGHPIFAPDAHGTSFSRVMDQLFHITEFPLDRWCGDTLYVLTTNEDLTVSQLLDFGKKWQASEVFVCDGTSDLGEWHSARTVKTNLCHGLEAQYGDGIRGVMIKYWWD